jgi:hypothetical protein
VRYQAALRPEDNQIAGFGLMNRNERFEAVLYPRLF